MTTGAPRLCRWPDVIVVGVVRRRDLERAGAEREVHVRVGDDRDAACSTIGSRTLLPDQVLVALVVGMHRDRDVAEHRLGAGRRDHERLRRIVGERVGDVVQRALLVVELGFLVGQ